MKLSAWLDQSRTRDNVFASAIGVSRVTLFRFKTGVRIPSKSVMERISAETNGAVTPNDFYGIGASGPDALEQSETAA